MTMTITISKDDFERALPVGTSAHDEVFDAVAPECQLQVQFFDMALLGEEGKNMVMEAEDGVLLTLYKRLVCVSAFLAVFRQLDLVLTPTGFGIVSNDMVSPEAWGKSGQAQNYIRHLFSAYSFFAYAKSTAVTYLDWQNMQPAIVDADEFLRTRISDELMDELLCLYRQNEDWKSLASCQLIALIRDFTDMWSRKGQDAARQPVFRRLMRCVESDPEVFKSYFNSNAYKRNHHETFQNSKDSTAFVFGC